MRFFIARESHPPPPKKKKTPSLFEKKNRIKRLMRGTLRSSVNFCPAAVKTYSLGNGRDAPVSQFLRWVFGHHFLNCYFYLIDECDSRARRPAAFSAGRTEELVRNSRAGNSTASTDPPRFPQHGWTSSKNKRNCSRAILFYNQWDVAKPLRRLSDFGPARFILYDL